VIQVFYEALLPLASTNAQSTFVAGFNEAVTAYNAAVVHTNEILASSTVTTH
jgi:hypothetical protein